MIGAGLVLTHLFSLGCGRGAAEPSYGVSQVNHARELAATPFSVSHVIAVFARQGVRPQAEDQLRCASVGVQAAPKDLLGWLQHHPRFRAGKPVRVSVGGIRGVRIDTTVTSGYHLNHCPGQCVAVFASSDVLAVATVGQSIRNYLLKVHGATVDIGILAPSAAFNRLAGAPDRVLSTVRFA